MKILKPLIAMTAFAASMSSFAQSPPPPNGQHNLSGRRAPQSTDGAHTQMSAESRQALRRDIGAFHTDAPRHTLAGAPTGANLVHVREPLATPGHIAERAGRREVDEHRKYQHEAHEGWAEKREALQARKEARLHKRAARRAHGHVMHDENIRDGRPVTYYGAR